MTAFPIHRDITSAQRAASISDPLVRRRFVGHAICSLRESIRRCSRRDSIDLRRQEIAALAALV